MEMAAWLWQKVTESCLRTNNVIRWRVYMFAVYYSSFVMSWTMLIINSKDQLPSAIATVRPVCKPCQMYTYLIVRWESLKHPHWNPLKRENYYQNGIYINSNSSHTTTTVAWEVLWQDSLHATGHCVVVNEWDSPSPTSSLSSTWLPYNWGTPTDAWSGTILWELPVSHLWLPNNHKWWFSQPMRIVFNDFLTNFAWLMSLPVFKTKHFCLHSTRSLFSFL